MNVPKLKKVSNADKETKVKIETMITDAVESDYINSHHLEDFSTLELAILTEYAKENDVVVFLKAEHSNFYQGVLVELLRKDCIDKMLKFNAF